MNRPVHRAVGRTRRSVLAICFGTASLLCGFAAAAEADPILRVTVEGQLFANDCAGCQLDDFDLRTVNYTLQMYISDIEIDRFTNGNGVDVQAVQYRILGWTLAGTGLFELLPKTITESLSDIARGQTTAGSSYTGCFCVSDFGFQREEGAFALGFDASWETVAFTDLDTSYGLLNDHNFVIASLRTPHHDAFLHGSANITEIAPVPEPSSLFLVGCVMVGAGVRRVHTRFANRR